MTSYLYYYSYFEEFPVVNSENNIVAKEQRRIYYDFAPDLQYFQVSNKTLFETHLVKNIVYNVEIAASSFESRADVYNFMHRELDKEVLGKLEKFSRQKNNEQCLEFKRRSSGRALFSLEVSKSF